jgi:L,D-transpeptidase catalytic domain
MEHKAILTRREIVGGAAAGLAVCAARPALAAPVFAIAKPVQPQINPGLLARARAALDAKSGLVKHRDVIGITDFSRASRDPRFYLVDVASGMVTEYHVAHGRGSDPAHTGWVERLSNEIGSEASSAGAYLTDDVYYGKYGRSLRLKGLDYSNSNAEERAIVVHGAWYADPKVVSQHGKLGRSEGCFALSELSLQYVLFRLGPGRLLYADKVWS